MFKTIATLKELRKQHKITTQEFKTYKGQVLAGDEEGCLKGLKRKKLIEKE